MKIKTQDLIGPALDWAVAECEGMRIDVDDPTDPWLTVDGIADLPLYSYSPSSNWSLAGPIIEREGINLRAVRKEGHSMDGDWLAAFDHGNTGEIVHWVKRETWHRHYLTGPTPLIAAMRCFVASKLGDEIEVPDELGEQA